MYMVGLRPQQRFAKWPKRVVIINTSYEIYYISLASCFMEQIV